jgi:hypothetical protein
VAVVVDPHFGERLTELAQRMHVWVVDTPANRPVAERIWSTVSEPSAERGVTVFHSTPDQSTDAWAAHVLATVVLHHGEYSHDPAVSIIEIHGAPITHRMRAALRTIGFTIVVESGGVVLASVPPAA